MSTISLSGYQLTLGDIKTRVKSIIKEDDGIDVLLEGRINDALQRICWEIIPRSLMYRPETFTWSSQIQEIPDRIMRIVSLTVPAEDRRVIHEVTPQDMQQRHLGTTIETRMPYYYARVGRNLAPSFTSWFADTLPNDTVVFDSTPDGGTIEGLFIYEHPKLLTDSQVIFLDPPFHGLVVDGALLEMADYTGESVSDHEKKQNRFERRLRRAKKRMNDEFAMPVIMGSSNSPMSVDRIPTIPKPLTSPRFP